MENYYEILQVSSNATKEIIDKAYKTLVKKYHPDANPLEKKEWAEEKIKKINEAYEIISDKDKRQKYDEQLKRNKQNIEQERYQRLYEQNQLLIKELNNLKAKQVEKTEINNLQNLKRGNINNSQEELYNNLQRDIDRKIAESVKKAYHDAYIQRMKSYGYKIRYKKTLKQKIKDLLVIVLAIGVIAIIFLILMQIPSFRDYIETNEVIQIFIKSFR